MSLEGLRAWVGEVERKLGKRTRVFLALAVIAIGLGGAAIYLAIDARESSVSESDVRELQQQLEAQIDAAATNSPVGAVEPVEPTPEPEPEPGAAPESKPKSSPDKGAGTGGVGAGGANTAKIPELLERAQEQNAEAEAEQAGK